MNPFGFLFPPACPICGTVLKKTEKKVCLTCRRKLSEARVAEPACARCGKPLEEIETEYCMDCEKKRRKKYDSLRQGTALWIYTDSLKEAMASFKYEGCYENAAFFAEEFIRFRKEKLLAWKPDFLIPVPLHRHRRWFRGYNQAEILAEEIGKRLHLPVENDVLCRNLDTNPQKQLDDKARYRNMVSAFYVPESAIYKLNGKRVVLIDDIYTTGSTLEACAGELKKAGVSEIYSACLCIGRDY